ncbi:MAG: hypothetical protein M3546_09890 [Actinomycetota bacterium]|nr:hypothetical protein [Actinomycetota bacterium]
MSAAVAVGIFVLHSPWADDEVGVLPPPLATGDFDLAPQPKPQLPTQTVIVRIRTPAGACWSGTIDGDPRSGCGPFDQLIDVQGQVNVYLEPESSVDMPIVVAFEVDGRIVQTVGPTTAQYPTIDFSYFVPPSG